MVTCSELLAYMFRTPFVYLTRLDNVFGIDWDEPMQHLISLGLVSEYQYKHNKAYRMKMSSSMCGISKSPYQTNTRVK